MTYFNAGYMAGALGMSLCFLCQKPPIFLILTIYLTFTLCVAKQMLSG